MSDQDHSNALHALVSDLNAAMEAAAQDGLTVSIWSDGDAEPLRMFVSVAREVEPQKEEERRVQ